MPHLEWEKAYKLYLALVLAPCPPTLCRGSASTSCPMSCLFSSADLDSRSWLEFATGSSSNFRHVSVSRYPGLVIRIDIGTEPETKPETDRDYDRDQHVNSSQGINALLGYAGFRLEAPVI